MLRDLQRALGALDPARIGVMLILVSPLVLPFARRLGPPALVAGAGLALLAWRLRAPLAAGLRPRALSAFELGCLVFFAWAFASLAWTPAPLRGFAQVSACALVFAAGVAFFRLAPASSQLFHKLFAGALAAAASISTLDLSIGSPLAQAVRGVTEAHRYNMVALSLLVMVCGLAPHAQAARGWRLVALCAVAVFVLASDSESAKLALAGALAAYALAHLVPQRALALLVGLCFLTCVLAAPWLGAALEPLLGARGGAFLEAGHAGERLEIWLGSGAFALQGLPWGHGAGASLAYAQDLASAPRGMGWGHAHNAFIQVWLELGGPGAAFALLACLAIARTLARVERGLFPGACALVAAGALASLVSHGLWQAWWWSALFIGALALRLTGTKPLTFDRP